MIHSEKKLYVTYSYILILMTDSIPNLFACPIKSQNLSCTQGPLTIPYVKVVYIIKCSYVQNMYVNIINCV